MAERINGSEALMRSLLAEGVDTPFLGILAVRSCPFTMPFTITEKCKPHTYTARTRCNSCCTRLCQGNRQTGVCFATSGPGATNLLTGIADAMIDSTPVVCITGQVASPLLGTDAFQESDIVGMRCL
jgi:acetolactate synthase I/II/III large subunit